MAGGGYNEAGATLENTHHDLLGPDRQLGFDPHVREDRVNGVGNQITNVGKTVPHHFAEFLRMGYTNHSQSLPGAIQDGLDSPQRNPGDNRSGHFAAMLGEALSQRQLTVQQAVDLTRYAYIGANGQHTNRWARDNMNADENWNVSDWLTSMQTGRQSHEQGEAARRNTAFPPFQQMYESEAGRKSGRERDCRHADGGPANRPRRSCPNHQ